MVVSIAVANHKGGTGKTTTTHCLGVHFAEGGYRVLMVDADPQSTLTVMCGIKSAAGRSLAEVLGGAQPGRLSMAEIVQTIGNNLDLAPASNAALSATEAALPNRQGWPFVLRQALAPVASRYDMILIDCSPGRGALVVNALAAAKGVLCPTQPSLADLAGLKLFRATVDRIREKGINPALELIGFVPTFYKGQTVLHQGTLAGLRADGLPVLQPIGESIRVQEAPALGQSVLTYAPDNPVSLAYRKLGRQVEQWVSHVTQ